MGLTWHWIWMHPRSAFCGQLSYLHALNAVPNTVLNCGSADELWVLAASCGNLGSNRASWCEIRWPERGPTQLGLPSQVPKSFSPSHSEELARSLPFPAPGDNTTSPDGQKRPRVCRRSPFGTILESWKRRWGIARSNFLLLGRSSECKILRKYHPTSTLDGWMDGRH